MSTAHQDKPDIFAADTASPESPLANFAEQQVALYRLREAQRKANEEAEKAETKALEERAMKVASEAQIDRKSTRLNSSHVAISYAVFCLKKKKKYYSLPFILLLLILPQPRSTLFPYTTLFRSLIQLRRNHH